MSKSRDQTSTQTTDQRVDPQTAAFIAQYRNTAQGLYGQSPNANPYLTQAAGVAGNLTGNLGFAGQQGLAGIDQYFNPYQQQVVQGVQSDFDRQRQLATNQAADMATRSGAFGGSRQAVLDAELQRGVNQNEAQQLANLRYGGYTNAANQMLQQQQMAANLGLSGLQGLFGLGQHMDARQLQALQAMMGGMGPIGTSGTQTTTTPLRNNPIQGAMGGAAIGTAIAPGVGTLVGGGLGLLGSLF